MADSIDTILTTSGINSLVASYINDQTNRMINPISTRKNRYQNLSSTFAAFSSKLGSLKSILSDFKVTGSTSLFNAKASTSSNSSFITANVISSASIGVYNMRVNQLAKNDVLVSQDFSSSAVNAITGTHSFVIKTGDGSNPDFTSTVDVTFTGSETNQAVMEKIRDAINSDKAVVQSGAKSASAAYNGGEGSFKINLGGVETTISVTGGGTYEELIDEIVSKVNSGVSGVSAEKVLDSPNPGDVSLKLAVADSTKYISITNESGFDVAGDLNIDAVKEKGASGMVSASAFTPASGYTQFSLTSKETGVDFRIKELTDIGSALSSIGLNIGTNRPEFDQSQEPDTAGFLYADISSDSLLNAKINFNGLILSRNKNVIDDLVNGVTFNLKSAMQATDPDVNVSVANDVQSIKAQAQNFINKFNEAYQYIKSSSSSGGVLAYDSQTSSLLNVFRSVAYTNIPGLPAGNLNSLSQIGISFDTAAGLSITDNSKFEMQVNENAGQVAEIFNSTNGIANTLFNQIDPYLGASGYLALKQSSYDSNVKSLNDKITATEERINKSAGSLRSQYERLQMQLAVLISSQNLLGLY